MYMNEYDRHPYERAAGTLNILVYLPQKKETGNSYRIGLTWRWVNDDGVIILGLNIPLIKVCLLNIGVSCSKTISHSRPCAKVILPKLKCVVVLDVKWITVTASSGLLFY